MVSLSQRMRKLQTTLLSIRLGPGAAILPKDVKRLHLRFARKIDDGHMGPRKFWRHELVRLKYHNPAIPMTVDRSAPQTDPAILSIHFAPADSLQTSSSSTSSPAATSSTTASTTPSEHTPADRVETIDMKHKSNADIFDELLRVTRGEKVLPTAEEREELRTLEEQRRRSERESKISQEVRARKKREEEILNQARGEVAQAA